MKLSEAGLLGSLEVETCKGYLFGINKRSCFLGGVLIASGFVVKWPIKQVNMEQESAGYNALMLLYPIVKEKAISPITGTIEPIMLIIEALNDSLGWTRPQIAKWVAAQEAIIEAKYTVEPLPKTIEQPLPEPLPTLTSCG